MSAYHFNPGDPIWARVLESHSGYQPGEVAAVFSRYILPTIFDIDAQIIVDGRTWPARSHLLRPRRDDYQQLEARSGASLRELIKVFEFAGKENIKVDAPADA